MAQAYAAPRRAVAVLALELVRPPASLPQCERHLPSVDSCVCTPLLWYASLRACSNVNRLLAQENWEAKFGAYIVGIVHKDTNTKPPILQGLASSPQIQMCEQTCFNFFQKKQKL